MVIWKIFLMTGGFIMETLVNVLSINVAGLCASVSLMKLVVWIVLLLNAPHAERVALWREAWQKMRFAVIPAMESDLGWVVKKNTTIRYPVQHSYGHFSAEPLMYTFL